MLPTGLVIAAVAALLAWAGGLLVIRFAPRLGLVAAPNDRSSHANPTPTGGGLGIVLGGTLAGIPTALTLPWPALPAIAAGLGIALLGFLDDRKPWPVRRRLIVQAFCVAVLVANFPMESLSGQLWFPFSDGILGVTLIVAGVLWVNLYNFMDGIDGLAAGEAAFILLAVLWLAPDAAHYHVVYWWIAAVAAAALGFLVLNRAPARLFMGDTGSTYLALMLGFFALATLSGAWLSLWQWLILLAAFLADSLVTLAVRIYRRERFWEAHRRHAYQQLARRFGSHGRVTLIYLVIDAVFLLPLAWLSGAIYPWGWAPCLAAYVVLVPAALLAGAGAPEARTTP